MHVCKYIQMYVHTYVFIWFRSASPILSRSLSRHLSPLILLNADGTLSKARYHIDIVAAFADNIHFSEISGGQSHRRD